MTTAHSVLRKVAAGTSTRSVGATGPVSHPAHGLATTLAGVGRRRLRPGLLVASLLASAGLALGCSGTSATQSTTPASGSAPAGSSAPDGPIALDVASVVERPLDVQLSLPGELTPYRFVDLHSRANAFVRTIAVDRGSRVRRGDVLAELEAPELVAQAAEAQSKLQAAEAQLATARARSDADNGTFAKLEAAAATPGVVAGNELMVARKVAEASRSQVSGAEQLVEAARQAVQAVRDMESYLRITAPFDGVVTERSVHPGALVGPSSGAGNPLLRVVERDRLRLVVPVPEAYVPSVAPGMELTFSVAAYPGERFTGRVSRAAQEVDTSKRTMAVELDVANADGRLSPGTYCQVRWPVTRSTPSLMVPATSVATTTDRVFVIRLGEGKAEWIDVRTGLTSGPLIEVFGNLRPGDVIASRGTDQVRHGSPVQAREPKPAS